MEETGTVLTVQKRSELGKRVKRLRRAGLLPGNLYGPGLGSQPVQVEAQSFSRLYRTAGANTLIGLQLPGERRQLKAFIHEVQREPVHGKILHVDFYAPNLWQKGDFEIPVVFTGESPASKGSGGMLLHGATHVKVRCLPTEVPHEVRVDLGQLLGVDDSIKVGDITLPAGVEVLTGAEEILARVVAPRIEPVEVLVEEAAVAAPTAKEEQPAATAVPEGQRKEE